MTAYKATHNMKCRDFTYEVGKTYSISKLEICDTGFHYCPKMGDTLEYYDYHPINFILLEVEILGNVETKDDKGATDKMKVLRIVPKEEYDENMLKGINRWSYDDKGNKLSYTYYNGDTDSWTYDDKGNVLSHTDYDGDTESWTYDDKGNMMSYINYNGRTQSYTYDDKGNKLSHTNYFGKTVSWTYNDKGNMLSHTYYDGGTQSWTCDDKGNMLSHTDYNGGTASWTCDDKGNKLSYSYNNKLQWEITID